MNTIEENTHNLTSLWKLASQSFNQFMENENYCKSVIKYAEWPNKIWLKSDLTDRKLNEIKAELNSNSNLVFSFFNIDNTKSIPLNLKSVQYGMSLNLTEKFKISEEIILKKVETLKSAELWESTYYKSVKYKINAKIITSIKDKIDFFIAYHNNQVIGTIVTYKTGKTIGIHSLSVLPIHRKKGYATEIMVHILNQSLSENLSLVTLQASKMAKKMYEKIGFVTEFTMENYQNKTI